MFFSSKPKNPQIDYPYTIKNTPVYGWEKFDNQKFKTCFFPAVGSPVGRILMVHGFGEHAQVFYRFMDALSLQGYEVYFFDQRGAGETSPGNEVGKTNEFHTFNDLEHFVDLNLAEVQKTHGKLFMFGHSMGGGICLNYGVRGKRKSEISGVIVTGPLVELHPTSAPSKAVLKMAPLLMPLAGNYTFDTALKIEGITNEKSYQQWLLGHPMSSPLYGSLRQIYDMLMRGKDLTNAEYVSKFTLPVLILHGSDDVVNDPQASQVFHDLLPAAHDKKLIFYDNARHSLHIEVDSVFEKLILDVLDWLSKH